MRLGPAEAVIAVITRHLPRRLSHVEPAGAWSCPNLDQYSFSPNCIIIVGLRVPCPRVLLYIFRAPRNQPYPNQYANSLPHYLGMGCEVIYTSLESNQRRRWSNASLISPDAQSWASHITRPSCISWHISAATSLCDSEIKFNLTPHWRRKKGSPPVGQSPPRTVFLFFGSVDSMRWSNTFLRSHVLASTPSRIQSPKTWGPLAKGPRRKIIEIGVGGMPSRAGGANWRRLGDIHHEQGSAMISSVRPIPTPYLLVGSYLPCGCDFGSHSTHYRALKLELDKCTTQMMTRHRASPCNSGPVYGVRSRQGQDRCIWWSRDNYLILAVCRRGYRSEMQR